MRNEKRFQHFSRLTAAFLAGQAVMLGLVLLLRPAPARARQEAPRVAEMDAILVRRDSGKAGIQLAGEGATGGPNLTMFDKDGTGRLQLTVDGNNRPLIILRNKAGKVALGIGLDNDEPAISALNDKGVMVKIPLPKE